jgi:plastocyanin
MVVVASVVAVAGLLAAACGSSQKPDFSGQLPEDAPHIDQDALRFKPNELTVAAGEQVYFTNSETALHNVTVDGDTLSGNMQRGDVFVHTFESPGTYQITCTFHAQMRSTITVE